MTAEVLNNHIGTKKETLNVFKRLEMFLKEKINLFTNNLNVFIIAVDYGKCLQNECESILSRININEIICFIQRHQVPRP